MARKTTSKRLHLAGPLAPATALQLAIYLVTWLEKTTCKGQLPLTRESLPVLAESLAAIKPGYQDPAAGGKKK